MVGALGGMSSRRSTSSTGSVVTSVLGKARDEVVEAEMSLLSTFGGEERSRWKEPPPSLSKGGEGEGEGGGMKPEEEDRIVVGGEENSFSPPASPSGLERRVFISPRSNDKAREEQRKGSGVGGGEERCENNRRIGWIDARAFHISATPSTAALSVRFQRSDGLGGQVRGRE